MLAPLLAGLVATLGPARVDWTEGMLEVRSGAPPSLRAPSPHIARIGAERTARERGTTRLLEAVKLLPVLGGGTVGRRMEREEAVAERIATLVAAPAIAAVEYASDGGVEIVLRLALDDLAAALGKAPPPPSTDAGAQDGAPVARLLKVRKKGEPSLIPGASVRHYGSLAEARRDPSIGETTPVVEVDHLRARELKGERVAIILEAK